MKQYPHVQAAWVNTVCEEGTREELCKHIQQEWNAACFHEARADKLAEENKRLREALGKSATGWANALELDIIQEKYRTSAEILRDEARAAIGE